MGKRVRLDGPGARRRGGGALAFALAVGLAAAATADEMLVVGSTAPGLAPGDVAPTGSAIEIPRDAEVTLVAPSGGVLTIEGPWAGRIDAPAGSEGTGLIQRLYALFQMPDRRARFGATRSLSSCLAIDLEADRDICVSRPSCVVFSAGGTPQETVSLTGPDGAALALSRGMGAGMWRWPGDTISRSGTYTVRAGDPPTARDLEVHVQPELSSRAHEIAWMAEQGCVRQAQEALATLSEE